MSTMTGGDLGRIGFRTERYTSRRRKSHLNARKKIGRVDISRILALDIESAND